MAQSTILMMTSTYLLDFPKFNKKCRNKDIFIGGA